MHVNDDLVVAWLGPPAKKLVTLPWTQRVLGETHELTGPPALLTMLLIFPTLNLFFSTFSLICFSFIWEMFTL